MLTSDDLVGVQMLRVRVPAPASIALIHGPEGRRLSELLERIPTDVAMGEPDATALIGADSVANEAWSLLEGLDGIGWVTAGKLLARKRPHLIPVYDRVVRCALGRPANFWLSMHHALFDAGLGLTKQVDGLRQEAAVPPGVSDLRIIDVVIWMSHRADHAQRRCD